MASLKFKVLWKNILVNHQGVVVVKNLPLWKFLSCYLSFWSSVLVVFPLKMSWQALSWTKLAANRSSWGSHWSEILILHSTQSFQVFQRKKEPVWFICHFIISHPLTCFFLYLSLTGAVMLGNKSWNRFQFLLHDFPNLFQISLFISVVGLLLVKLFHFSIKYTLKEVFKILQIKCHDEKVDNCSGITEVID